MDKTRGTAAVLHATRFYEGLVGEYGPDAADGLMAVAIRKARPDAEITPRDVKGFSKVVQVLRTGDVDLQATVSEGGVKAEKATQEMLARLQSPAKREPADEEDKVS